LHVDSIKVCTVILCLPIVRSDRVKCGYGLVLFGSLPEGTCVRRRAETRASIAQYLVGVNEGARDRVVTGLLLELQ
jgi:hypothetical protein